jgi:hypothetical protein
MTIEVLLAPPKGEVLGLTFAWPYVHPRQGGEKDSRHHRTMRFIRIIEEF